MATKAARMAILRICESGLGLVTTTGFAVVE
jgi:hypothetical protein